MITVTPTHFITHSDTVPRFAANPTHTAVQNGNWSDPTTWGSGVPNLASIVLIPNGIEINYTNAQVDAIEIQGILRASVSTNSQLLGNDIQIHPDGSLIIGESLAPISNGILAEVIIRNNPNKLSTIDLAAYGQGVANFGTWKMYGQEKSNYYRVTVEPRVGHNTLTLEASPFGWNVGDDIIIPDTRPYLMRSGGTNWTEKRTIQSIADNVVTLNSPLSFNHLGGKNGNYVTDILPHVANITRNVVVRSENPAENRGHTIEFADCDSRHYFARFSGLGRTKVGALKDNVKNADGTVIINNKIGRYSSHKHHLSGPVNPNNEGYQFVVEGCVFDDMLKWGLAIHDSHFGDVSNNVFYNAQGSAIALEDGSEYLNLVQNNFICKVTGGLSPADIGDMGDGIWMKGTRSVIMNNIVADIFHDGYHYDTNRTADKTAAPTQMVKLPKFRGADTNDAAQVDTVNLRKLGLFTFTNNEGYGCLTYAETWDMGNKQFYTDAEPVLFDAPIIWNTKQGFTFYDTNANIIVDGVFSRGNWEYPGPLSRCGSLIRWSRFGSITLSNFDVQGWECAVYSRDRAPSSYGPATLIIQDGIFKNHINMGVSRFAALRQQDHIWNDVTWQLTPTTPVGGLRANSVFDEANSSGNPVVQTFQFNSVNGEIYSAHYVVEAAGLGLTPAQVQEAKDEALRLKALNWIYTDSMLALHY